MAYDEKLAQRIREIVYLEKDPSERKMFGGVAFMVGGHMVAGLIGDRLMARIPPAMHEEALCKPHVAVMDFTGRPMAGYIYVDAEGIKTEKQLAYWLKLGIGHVRTLPPKGSKALAKTRAKTRTGARTKAAAPPRLF
jgi:hypothetical protein